MFLSDMVKEVAAREVCVDEGVVGRSGGRNKLIKERKSKIIYPASNSIEKKGNPEAVPEKNRSIRHCQNFI